MKKERFGRKDTCVKEGDIVDGEGCQSVLCPVSFPTPHLPPQRLYLIYLSTCFLLLQFF